VVVTEFGPVPVSWENKDGSLHFKFTLPAKTMAQLALPARSGLGVINVNGMRLRGTVQGSRLCLGLKAGTYSGEY